MLGVKLIQELYPNSQSMFIPTYKEEVMDALYVEMANGAPISQETLETIDSLFEGSEIILVPGTAHEAVSLTETINIYTELANYANSLS